MNELFIQSKDTTRFLFKGIFYSFVVFIFLLFVFFNGRINLIELAGCLVVFFIFLIGVLGNFFDFKDCKGKNVSLKIENDILYINDEKVPLKNKFLFLESKKCDKLFNVSLYEEKDTKTKLLLKIILDEKEYINFLRLIKPYKKLPIYISETEGIFICKNGFSINGRELFYDEISFIEWETRNHYCSFMYCSKEINIYITLKNNVLIEVDFDKRNLIYVKLMYINTLLEKSNKITTKNKKIAKMFNKLVEKIKKEGCEDLV